MKIATFNINNVNKRLANLLAWLHAAKPDIVCLQELKAETRAFPVREIEEAGYYAVWQGQRTWNGVAILSKREPVLIRRALPGDKSDEQARYIEAAVSGIVIACIYLPNGNPQPGPKFDYKLAWFDRLIKHAKTFNKENVPAVLAGDFNVVPDLAIDIYPTRSWDKDALTQPEPRARFGKLLGDGWLDSLRAKHPNERIYTYWDYKRQRWDRNGGLRLDHLLLNEPLHRRLTRAGVDKEVRGQEGASDHAPTWVELKTPRGQNSSIAAHQQCDLQCIERTPAIQMAGGEGRSHSTHSS
ncbi:MAG: exodeoxyribonuclease III [Alphaproteobacteria bacterium]|nr:exodeoxyribonuclease III [Alphaproteobacteria bacterium]